MAESGRASAASTSDAVRSDAVRSDAVSSDAVGNRAAGDRRGAADSVTVVLRGADTARVRMPTPAERTLLGLDPDVPVWVISRADGGTELYPGDTTVIVPAG